MAGDMERHFSWQAQHCVKLWKIAGAGNVVFCSFRTKCVAKMGRVSSPKRRVRDDQFMVGLSSDHARIIVESSFFWRKQLTDFSLKSLNSESRGRRSVW